MSCGANQTTARTNFNSASFSSGVSPIEVYEETKSTNNQATVSVTKGTLGATLTFSGVTFPTVVNGTGSLYLKVAKQTDGSSNTPPITPTTPATYSQDSAQAVTLNTTFTSTTYANTYGSSAPTFSAGNDCGGADKIYGWFISDAQVIMVRTPIFNASFTTS